VLHRNSKRIAFMMCKGGVGKTTSSFFVSQRLVSYGARVLAIDTDPQSNLTSAFRVDQKGIRIHEQTPVLADVLEGTCRLDEALIEISPRLHLLPSTGFNSMLDQKLSENFDDPVTAMNDLLSRVDHAYDFIVIDCAPALNLINASTSRAVETVFFPIELDEFSYLGLDQTINEIMDLEREYDFKTEKKVLVTKLELKDRTAFYYLGKVAERYRPLVCKTTIRASHDIRSTISENVDLFRLPRSTAKTDYDNLTREIMGISCGPRQRKGQLSAQV
jgi:chromosome partitioning protein